MQTRLSKIARLPAKTREQLNLRLHNGELSRTILPWVNALPRTKKVLAEIFHGNPITHQNLSEWRATGYQDWLFHQDRLQWFSRLEEEDKEISKHDGCADTYEAMSRFFIFEIGQAMQAAQKIKNPDARWEKMERLTEKFARLQNSYNWSRRVQLEFDKYNHQFEPEEPNQIEPQSPELPEEHDHALENGDRACPERSEPRPRLSHLRSESSESLVSSTATEVQRDVAQPSRLRVQEASRLLSPEVATTELETIPEAEPEKLETKNPKPEICENAPCPSEPNDQPANPATAGSLSELRTPISDLPTPTKCQPIPTPAPTTPQLPLPKPSQPPTWKTHKVHSIPIRGRRFVCIEG